MRRRNEAGFSLIEALIATALLLIVAAPILHVSAAARRLARSQAEATDLQQRARVAAEKLQRDLLMAGAGPLHGGAVGALAEYLPPILPARTGTRSADAPMSAYADRVTVLFVPDGGWSAALSVPMADPLAGVVPNPGLGCPAAGLCGFLAGSRALIFDALGRGRGHDLFTVTGIDGQLAHDDPFSRSYDAATSIVVPIVQRVYHFDRAGRRLMLYDGDESDLPLIDNVVDLRFSYFARDAAGLRPIPLAEMMDGPALGIGGTVFDADLLRIAVVRVTIRLEAAADDVRGAAAEFARAGTSTRGESRVPDVEMTFDVAPRNLRGAGGLP